MSNNRTLEYLLKLYHENYLWRLGNNVKGIQCYYSLLPTWLIE